MFTSQPLAIQERPDHSNAHPDGLKLRSYEYEIKKWLVGASNMYLKDAFKTDLQWAQFFGVCI